MQAGNALARRTDDGKDGGGYPSMGSVAAKFRGANAPALPAFVGLAEVRQAFDIDREPDRVRDFYGRSSVGEKALLARRLVEAGNAFVLVSGCWGYFDLAATVFRHLGIPLDAQWTNPQGRPIPIVTEGGQALPELG